MEVSTGSRRRSWDSRSNRSRRRNWLKCGVGPAGAAGAIGGIGLTGAVGGIGAAGAGAAGVVDLALFNDYDLTTVIDDKLASIYTKSDVDTIFSNMISTAPEALNTLSELAAALNNDGTYATTTQNQLVAKASIADTFAKSVAGPSTILTLDSKFRITTNNDDNLTIQKYDDDGAIITDYWLDVAQCTFDKDTNNSCLIMNNANVLALIQDQYTKAEVDALDDLKQNVLISGAVGIPLLSTQVDNQIIDLVGTNHIYISY